MGEKEATEMELAVRTSEDSNEKLSTVLGCKTTSPETVNVETMSAEPEMEILFGTTQESSTQTAPGTFEGGGPLQYTDA